MIHRHDKLKENISYHVTNPKVFEYDKIVLVIESLFWKIQHFTSTWIQK